MMHIQSSLWLSFHLVSTGLKNLNGVKGTSSILIEEQMKTNKLSEDMCTVKWPSVARYAAQRSSNQKLSLIPM